LACGAEAVIAAVVGSRRQAEQRHVFSMAAPLAEIDP